MSGWGTCPFTIQHPIADIYGITKVQAVTLTLLFHTLLLFPMAALGTMVIVTAGVKLSDLKKED